MATTDFVMPKLGLTMTEGTIARWDAAPGKSFAQGDIILVVETDKIAYDVEAPAPGVLQEVLVAAGNAVAVGTPIGRWDVGDIKVSLDAPDIAPAESEPVAAPAVAEAQPPVAQPSRPGPRADGSRTLATPYARRLARQAGIDLRGLEGSGPRGRIKAADIERAIAAKGSAPRPSAVPAAAEASRAATYSAGVEIDVTALLSLTEQINGDLPDLRADFAHFAVLAAAKVAGVFSEPLVIGLAANRESGERKVSLVAGADCRTLSGLIAQAKNSAAVLDAAAPRGTLWIERALDGISFLSADPPSGWAASLTIGAVSELFRPDAEGRAVRAARVAIVLTARASVLDPQQGQRLLREIRHMLEAPLLLLAS
jgi:pyruvate dehydrogenase E2 component (dihydrolipoyllysine-residue acetyltransferase)